MDDNDALPEVESDCEGVIDTLCVEELLTDSDAECEYEGVADGDADADWEGL